MNQKDRELKSKLRLDVNRTLIAIAFTVFALIISLNADLLRQSFWVPLQLTLSIPLLLSSIFARSKLAHTKLVDMWEDYGFFTFLVGYSFLLNVLGILLAVSIGKFFGILFLVFNILVSVFYSYLEIVEEKKKLLSRIEKDTLFIILLVVGGILPSLWVY